MSNCLEKFQVPSSKLVERPSLAARATTGTEARSTKLFMIYG